MQIIQPPNQELEEEKQPPPL